MAHELMNQLDRDGFVLLPQLITSTQLREMQQAFEARLRHMAWNDTLGYERTEMYRHMIQDVLILDQGFLNVALHPLVQQVLKEYLGPHFQLVEAKGWRSLPTKKDFHGWHGDAWYDQKAVSSIPREVKLAFYLTDVRSGAFNYIKGSHRKQHPRPIPSGELTNISNDMIVEATGPAGSAFMFDTSGTHRQAMPVLEPRQAVFLNYHDPATPLQQEDIKYYRYHPLLLNAAFLDNLSMEDRRILGFGDKRNFQHGFERRRRHPILESLNRSLMEATLHVDQALYYPRRALSKARRFLGF
jgi:hypothetical protein